MDSILLGNVKEYVLKTLTDSLPPNHLYHDFSHTVAVVKSAQEIANGLDLNDDDKEILLIAAWFHDVGFIERYQGHETVSAKIASTFLESQRYSSKKIQLVTDCIVATSEQVEPKATLEEILTDADYSHLASPSYEETSDLLREELRLLNLKQYGEEEWINENINLFNKHRYLTVYAAENWLPQKNKNLLNLHKRLKKLHEKANKNLRNQKSKPERGIETLYRTSLRNHMELSSIADTKANILLSVNAIIISLVLANLIPKLDNPSNSHLIYPTIIFISFSLVSMSLSILATRPKITTKNFSQADIENRKVNLLFFGNFHKLDLNDYVSSMRELIKDRDYLYDSLSKDLYYLGMVLIRKYRLLRITYAFFVIGILCSIVSFAIAFKVFGN